MKSIHFNLIALTAILAVSSGCSVLIGAVKGSTPSANKGNTNTKPAGTPSPSPKIEDDISSPPEVKKTPELTESEKKDQNFEDYLNEIPKGKLDDRINQDYFDRIKEGMSHSDLVRIFEDKGMLIGIMNVNGRHTLAYMWATANMKKRIRVTFEKDKVVEKQKDGF